MAYGDPKVVVDVKEAEHGEIVYKDHDGKTRTYYPSYSIWMHVQTLEVLTILGVPKEAGAEPPLVTRVRGTAVLEDRSISVIGDPASKSRTLTISFESSDWRPPHEDDSNPLLSYRSDLGGARLGFNRADWEIGNSDDWWCACYMPENFMKVLVADIRSGQLHELRVCLLLKRLYTSEHSLAPISMRGDLVVRPDLRTNDVNNADSPFGWVDAIMFASARMELCKPEPPESDEQPFDDDEPKALVPENPIANAVAILATRVEQTRSTVKWVGCMIVAALLIICFK